MHTQLTVSRSNTRLRLKYSTTATPTAKTEQMNCRTDRPKKSVLRYARISLLILISIMSPYNPIISFAMWSADFTKPTNTSRLNMTSPK